MVREELDAPARTYLLDVLGEAEQAVVRGYAGFWYDGEDAELMTIGVGKMCIRDSDGAAYASVERPVLDGNRCIGGESGRCV